MGRIDFETETMVAHALRAEGFDASEDGTGRGTPIVPVVAASLTRGAESAGKGGYAGRRQEDDVNIIARPVLPINTQIATRHKALGRGTGFGVGDDGDPAFTLTKEHHHAIATGWAVRRLTPTECCRLQGFPDDYFDDVTYRGKKPTDGPIYKALGNSMAIPPMRVIGTRIAMVEGQISARAAA